MRVTVDPDGAELFPGGSWAAPRPFLGHSTLNCVSSEVTTWKPALLRSDSAFPRDSHTTSGTVTSLGPCDRTMSTDEFLSTLSPGRGSWETTVPSGSSLGWVLGAPSARGAPSSAATASP